MDAVAEMELGQDAADVGPAATSDYWTADTLAGMAALYPGMDRTPYRAG